MKDITILLDMDEVIVDTFSGFIKTWKEMFPDILPIPYERQVTFNLEGLYALEYWSNIARVWSNPRLFYDLKPLPGALESIEEIRRKVKDVAICSSTPKHSKYAAQEKYEWVRDNLDNDWLKRFIITRDKTRVKGDILIDDKPRIVGDQNPSWEHILYTHPWNARVNHLRRLTWDNWREVLTELE